MNVLPRLESLPQEDASTGVLTVPELDDGTGTASNYRVILYNDDFHAFDEVVEQVVKATGCTLEKAAHITLEAHRKGRSVCFKGERGRCHEVARVLREIRLQCEVDHD